MSLKEIVYFFKEIALYIEEKDKKFTSCKEKILLFIKTLYKDFSEFGNQFVKRIHEIELTYIIIIDLLDKYEWWVVPFKDISLDETLQILKKITKLPYKQGKRCIDEHITTYYKKDEYKELVKLINSWNNKYFDRRRVIFKDALDAHKKKKFTLSIPALAVQIEGIMWEWLWDNFQNSKGKEKNSRMYFNKRLGFDKTFIDDIRKELNEYIESDMEKWSYLDLREVEFQYNLHRINKFFEKPGLEKINPAKYENIFLNRNLIAHGIYLNYGKEAEVNSLKLFLLLEILFEIVEGFNKK